MSFLNQVFFFVDFYFLPPYRRLTSSHYSQTLINMTSYFSLTSELQVFFIENITNHYIIMLLYILANLLRTTYV